MVLGLPCQFDYRDVTNAFQRTFGHLLPRRLQNRDLIDGPYDRFDCLSPSLDGYNTSVDQVGRIQAREKEQATLGKVSSADIYTGYSSDRMRRGSVKSMGSDGFKKEVSWSDGVVGGEGVGGIEGKRGSISRAV
ncbi:hypothetical protein ABW20_dc0102945 [Dactylellina cionopaga]|nr:hypothetical protein ABW20_dc0102945 [Dactylellina cionopaga]